MVEVVKTTSSAGSDFTQTLMIIILVLVFALLLCLCVVGRMALRATPKSKEASEIPVAAIPSATGMPVAATEMTMTSTKSQIAI